MTQVAVGLRERARRPHEGAGIGGGVEERCWEHHRSDALPVAAVRHQDGAHQVLIQLHGQDASSSSVLPSATKSS
jgi:hypothetical protein